MNNLKLTITTLLIIICSQKIWAIDFFYNGIAYRITSNESYTVEVTFYDFNYYSGNITIPETVTDFSHIDEEREYTVTSIGAMAFYKSSELESVTLPNTVTRIGNSAFMDCTGLVSIDIPNSVTTIAQAAFSGCSSLTSIDIPSSITSIEGQVFENCSGLTSITIPNTVTYLSGYGTFANCTGLVTLNLPNSFTDDIGLCIDNCTNLTSINFAEGNPRYKSHDGIVFSHEMDSLLKYPQGRQGEYSIPYSVKAIGDCAFSGTAGLTSINIPSTVTSIGHYAFTYCISLDSFVLPNSVTKMGENIFKGCTGLTEPVYNNRLFAFCPSNYTSTYHIPDGVETIVGTAFQDCTGIDSVTIPSSVKTIGFNAFSRCGMTYVSLPESLDSIKSYAFYFCSQLSTINLPNSLTYIGADAFAYCDNLREPLFNDHYFARLPQNFAESYSIPEGIQEVLEYAFQDCDSLVSLSFPSSVNKIRNNAIYYCPNLFEIYFYSDVPPVTGSLYPWGNGSALLELFVYVPAGSLELYLRNTIFGSLNYCSIVEMSGMLSGKEMYYEILNDDGSITYQHLEYMADTIIGNERPEIIVRSNTHYDRDEIITEVTHEYVFERDSKVYWWNKTTEEFTTLYDYRAIVGDEWDIKVGNETITVHVDSTNTFCGYNNLNYRLLYISDVDNIFSGTIVCGIGHLSSFFPEKLMLQGEKFRVEGMRCYWKNGVLVFKNGEVDCDEIYEQYHYDDVEEKETEVFRIYPNPTEDIITIETQHPMPLREYRVTNLMGQTVISGKLNDDNQQIDITKLPSGMYFVSVGGQNLKIIKK